MNRKFNRLSLGGVHVEVENSMRKSGSMNPLVMLDSWTRSTRWAAICMRGDPCAALLEVLGGGGKTEVGAASPT